MMSNNVVNHQNMLGRDLEQVDSGDMNNHNSHHPMHELDPSDLVTPPLNLYHSVLSLQSQFSSNAASTKKNKKNTRSSQRHEISSPSITGRLTHSADSSQSQLNKKQHQLLLSVNSESTTLSTNSINSMSSSSSGGSRVFDEIELYHHSNSGQWHVCDAIEEVFDSFEVHMIEKAHVSLNQALIKHQFSTLLFSGETATETMTDRERKQADFVEILLDELDRTDVSSQLHAIYALLSISLGGCSSDENRGESNNNWVIMGNDGSFHVHQRKRMIQFNQLLLSRCNVFSQLIHLFKYHASQFVKSHSTIDDEPLLVLCNLLYVMMTIMLTVKNRDHTDKEHQLIMKEMQSDLSNGSDGTSCDVAQDKSHFVYFCFEMLRDTVLSNHVSNSRFPFKKVVLLMQQAILILLNEPVSPYEQANMAQLKTKIKEKDMNYYKYRHFNSEESLFSQSVPVSEAVSVMNSQEPKLYPSASDPKVNGRDQQEREMSRILLSNPTNAELLYRTMYSELPPLVLSFCRLMVASSSLDYRGFINFSSIQQQISSQGKNAGLELERHKKIVLKSVLTIIFCLIKQWKKDGHAMQSMNLCQLLLDANALPSLVNLIMDQNMTKQLGEAPYRLNIIDAEYIPESTGINWNNMYINVTCLRVIQKITKSVFYGIMYLINNSLHEKLYEILCRLDHKACPLLVTYASKILKNLIPFTSTEWRTRHNESLGWVYLHVNLTMCDTWLLSSKRGVNSLAGEAKKQIADRRVRIEKFNSLHYDRWWENMNEYLKQQRKTEDDIYDEQGNLMDDTVVRMYNSIQITAEDCLRERLL